MRFAIEPEQNHFSARFNTPMFPRTQTRFPYDLRTTLCRSATPEVVRIFCVALSVVIGVLGVRTERPATIGERFASRDY